ncbi:MAG: hypothetical protein WC707_02310 [Candidatus Babeliaceae bacterium]|jgi:hypothetical protein
MLKRILLIIVLSGAIAPAHTTQPVDFIVACGMSFALIGLINIADLTSLCFYKEEMNLYKKWYKTLHKEALIIDQEINRLRAQAGDPQINNAITACASQSEQNNNLYNAILKLYNPELTALTFKAASYDWENSVNYAQSKTLHIAASNIKKLAKDLHKTQYKHIDDDYAWYIMIPSRCWRSRIRKIDKKINKLHENKNKISQDIEKAKEDNRQKIEDNNIAKTEFFNKHKADNIPYPIFISSLTLDANAMHFKSNEITKRTKHIDMHMQFLQEHKQFLRKKQRFDFACTIIFVPSCALLLSMLSN